MVRRMGAILAAIILAAGLGTKAEAAEMGKIRIELDYGRAAEPGAVSLYYVAEPMEGGYRLGAVYGGGVIRKEDACMPELAQWLAERISSHGRSGVLDENGSVEFSGLEEGLYLAVQTEAPQGWVCTPPFLVPVPLYGEWEVLSCPKQDVLATQSPRTGQHPAPLFGAMGLVLSGMGLYLCVEKLRKK